MRWTCYKPLEANRLEPSSSEGCVSFHHEVGGTIDPVSTSGTVTVDFPAVNVTLPTFAPLFAVVTVRVVTVLVTCALDQTSTDARSPATIFA